MKQALIFSSLILSVFYSVDAQWHLRSCGVTDVNNCTSEEFTCLWERAEENIRKGSITTVVGVGILVVGIARTPSDGLAGYGIGPAILRYGGIITSATGLIIWISGLDRRSKLKTNLHHETHHSQRFKLSPSIIPSHFNNSFAFGLTASLSL